MLRQRGGAQRRLRKNDAERREIGFGRGYPSYLKDRFAILLLSVVGFERYA